MPPFPCPDRQKLTDFVLGKLPDEVLRVVADHVADCALCQETLTHCDDVHDTLISRIRTREPQHLYVHEAACERAVQELAAMGALLQQQFSDSQAGGKDQFVNAQLREYTLLEKLGEGGMGAVYRAVHSKLDAVVAVKILPAKQMRNADAVARFERERKVAAKLDHPNIVRARDAGEVDGISFLVMDFVEGLDLSKVAGRLGPLPIADACEVARQAALGLQHAHEHGLVHRDIKPSNLMLAGPPASLRADGGTATVKILDLGLALLDPLHNTAGTELTSTGQMMGTLDYMAPEQGNDSHAVDIRADIYSLGATLYRLLSGAPMFAGDRYDTPLKKLLALANDTAPPIRQRRAEVPVTLVEVLGRMLSKSPQDRFATPGEVAIAMEPFCKGADPTALLRAACETNASQVADSRTVSTMRHHSMSGEDTDGEAPSDQPLLAETMTLVRRRRPGRKAVLTTIVGAAVLLGILFLLATPHGTLVVEIESDDVAARIEQATLELEDKRTGRKYSITAGPQRFPSGEYLLHVSDDAGLEIDTPEFKIVRNRVTTVRVTRQARADATAQQLQVSPDTPIGNTAPLGALAWVARPARLPDLQSWTIASHRRRDSVTRVAFSPDGKWLATGGMDGTIRIRDANTGHLHQVLMGRGEYIKAIQWCPNSRHFVCGYRNRVVEYWEMGQGKPLATYEVLRNSHGDLREGNDLGQMALSPDGTRLAVANANVHIVDARSGRRIASLAHDVDSSVPGQLAWSPDGSEFAVARWNIVIYSLEDGEAIHTFDHVRDHCYKGVVWSPDGSRLAARTQRNQTSWESGQVRIWDSHTGELLREESANDARCYVAWSFDGTLLRIEKTGRVGLFDDDSTTEGEVVHGPVHYPNLSFAFSPDGKTLAKYDGQERALELVNARTGNAFATVDVATTHVWTAVSPVDGATLIAAQGQVCLVEPDRPPRFFRRPSLDGGVCWAPDGTQFASGGDGCLQVWDRASCERVMSIPTMEAEIVRPTWSPDGATLAGLVGRSWHGKHDSFVLSNLTDSSPVAKFIKETTAAVHFSPDGRKVAFGEVSVRDIASGETVFALKGPCRDLAWSPDGKMLAIPDGAQRHPVVNVWSVAENKTIGKMESTWHYSWLSAIAWSPDARFLAIQKAFGSTDHGVIVWDREAANKIGHLQPFAGTQGRGIFLRWFPKGKRLYSGSRQAQLRTWDVGKQTLCSEVRGYPEMIREMELLPDICIVVCTTQVGTTHFWDAKTGDSLLTVVLLPDGEHVAVSPEGHCILSPGANDLLNYIALDESGQALTLSAKEFATRYGWTNEPGKVSAPIQPQAGLVPVDEP